MKFPLRFIKTGTLIQYISILQNRKFLQSIFFRFLTAASFSTFLFYSVNYFIAEVTIKNINVQLKRNLVDNSYDQTIRWLYGIETLGIADCVSAEFVESDGTTRELIHPNSNCSGVFFNFFSGYSKNLSFQLPNSTIWRIDLRASTPRVLIVLILMIFVFLFSILFILRLFEEFKSRKKTELAYAKWKSDNYFYNLSRRFSHDIRSPLSAMNLTASVVSRQLPEQAELIKMAISRTTESIEAFLFASKKENYLAVEDFRDFSIIELKNILKSEVDLKGFEYFRQKLNIELVFQDALIDKVIIRGPQINELKNIVSNLINNSIEAVEKPIIRINFIVERARAVIQISDKGPGFPKHIIRGLGHEIQTTKTHGNGLGLYNAFNIIRAAGGDFRIINEASGSSAYIYLNVHE